MWSGRIDPGQLRAKCPAAGSKGMETMKHIAIIGASYLQLPLIEKAKELGFVTHVFAWAADDVGERAADHFYPISVVEAEQIAHMCREIGVCGVCSIASDLCAVTSNRVAHQLGLPGNSLSCTAKSSNKFLMREAFAKRGDPIPQYVLVDEKTELGTLRLRYPVIVKPTDRSGSRGICKLENSAGLQSAVEHALSQGFEKKALIEEFVDGQEYSVEGISFHGVHTILAVTKKFTTGAPQYIETGHMEPAQLDPASYRKICDTVLHALDSLEIQNSASHSEVKIDASGRVTIIEIGARMGGDCIGSDLVPYSTGIDFVKAVIQVACGEAPDLIPKGEIAPVEVRFLFSEADVRRMEEDERSGQLLKIIDFHPENLGQTTDSSNRAGCYLRKSRTAGTAE